MKKIFGALTFTLCLVAMVSCGGKKEKSSAAQVDPVKAKVESFYKAASAVDENDDKAIEKLNVEMEAYYNSLSTEEKERFEKYVLEIVEEEMGDDVDEYLEDAYEYAEKAMDDAYDYADDVTDDAYDYAEKAMDDAYDYAEKAMDNAYDYADDVTDDVYEYAEKAMEDAYEYAEKALEDAYDYSGGFDW